MHEFSVAESLVNAVLEEIERHCIKAGSLRSVTVVIGEMRQIVPDTLEFAYETLIRETAAAGSTIKLEFKPITAQCRKCFWEGRIDDHLFTCRNCGAHDIEIKTGKELSLTSMELNNE